MSGKREVYLILRKGMTVDEHDFAKMIAEVEPTSWRLCETIRVKEIAATHRLGQMRRLLIDARGAEGLEARSFFYRDMFNPRRPHIPDDFTLEMKVDVKRLRVEIILSQPAVNTWSEEPGSLRRSPATGTGSDEPGVS